MLGSSSTIRILVMLSSSMGHGRPPAPKRQRDDEFAAHARSALHDNLSIVGAHDVPYQRQAQAAAFGVVHQRVAHAIELFEDPGLLAAWYAHAVVNHLQFDV